jgi:hypothetical protein
VCLALLQLIRRLRLGHSAQPLHTRIQAAAYAGATRIAHKQRSAPQLTATVSTRTNGVKQQQEATQF